MGEIHGSRYLTSLRPLASESVHMDNVVVEMYASAVHVMGSHTSLRRLNHSHRR